MLIAEGPGHQRDTQLVLSQGDYEQHLRNEKLRFVDLNRDELIRAPLRASYTGMKDLWLPRTVLEADFLVSTPKIKTHHWSGVTLSMKNMFGVVPGARYGWPKNILHWKLLLVWRGQSRFNKDTDWVWASPYSAGERPLNLNGMQHDHIVPAAKKAGLESFGWHAFRHTYRAWLNDNGTPLGIQKDLMRHANISTTANVYGAAMDPSMREANEKIVKLVIQ